MRIIVSLVVAALMISVLLSFAQDTAVNFSGIWILDKDKSEMGEGGGRRGRGMAATKMIITQEKNKLIVESFRTNRNGEEISSTATYTLDGKKCENAMGNRTGVSTVEWSEDGKSLIIQSEMTFSRNDQEFTVQSEATWSLQKEELMIETTRSTSMGERTSKAVYRVEKK
ncbi:hypothetical protein JXO59_06605 [candidate division KSB1 bacterium]|nr:hypothetical protein [candidate division KSB1 bacterium]